MNEITKKIPISKGMVYKIIEEWWSNLIGINIEEIRIVTTELKKSDITLQQCVMGFRLSELLKKFGLEDNFDIDYSQQVEPTNDLKYQEKDVASSILNDNTIYNNLKDKEKNQDIYNKTQYNEDEITFFLKYIYNNCKNLGLQPEDIIKWIQDLLASFRELEEKEKEINFSNGGNFIEKSDLNIEYEQDPMEKVPYVSRISSYLIKKLEQIQQLKKTKSLILKDIKTLTEKNQNLKSRLDQTIEQEKKIITYFNWYSNLRKELFYKYNIIIEKEFGNFAKAINDFKQYNFDATEILAEYNSINSLKEQRVLTQSQVYQNQTTIESLRNEISSLEERGNYHKQTINIYQDLYDIGLGLKELKILCNLIMESALANEIDVKDSVKKFFKDVEDHYDDKLGFEKKLQDLRKEKEKIENQLPGYKLYLQQQLVAVSSLNNLNANGVTNTDIISINQLASIFKNTDFLSDPLEKNTNKIMMNTTNQVKPNESSQWQRFIEKLQSLKNINNEINKQISSLNNLKIQNSYLYNNKQKLENDFADLVTKINNIISNTNQLLDAARHFNHALKREVIPIPIFIVVTGGFGSSDDKFDKNKSDDKTNQ